MIFKITTGIKPFSISKINVNNPSFHPLVLTIFVAPMFFDPTNLGSLLLKSLDNSNPKGMDPTEITSQ